MEARTHQAKWLPDAAYCLQLAEYAIRDGKADYAVLLVLILYSPKSTA